MIRQALLTSGVAYHHGLAVPQGPFAGFAQLELGQLAETDLQQYQLLIAPRSTDAEVLWSRRHQIRRYLDAGNVLVAFGELWTDWFPGCRWEEECPEDSQDPLLGEPHAILSGLTVADLHWHPERERWRCHGHLAAPEGAEVLVRNRRGDAWMYVDRVSSNGVILASSNLDPDTHAYHGNEIARGLLDRILAWAHAEAEDTPLRRAGGLRIAGIYSGVHFQRAFYQDPEFAPYFSVLPVWELAGADLSAYDAVWVPGESNQDVLFQQRQPLARYVERGGVLVSFEQTSRDWSPARSRWSAANLDLDRLERHDHPALGGLDLDAVRWHARGAYEAAPDARVLIGDGQGRALLVLEEPLGDGAVLAGTLDPDRHSGLGAETTRPLLRALIGWIAARSAFRTRQLAAVSGG